MFGKLFTTVKYTLVTVNLLFVVTGIIILSVGISVQSAYNEYHHFLADRFFSLPAFCIATGVIIFLIAAAGFYGAFMQNYYMNMAYAGAMVIILVFQVSACIAGFALRGNTLPLVQQQLTTALDMYGPAYPAVTKLWDEVQRDFECCGVTNATDWFGRFNTTTDEDLQAIPVSCCNRTFGAIAIFSCTALDAFPMGCAQAFGDFISSHAASIGIAGVFLIMFQSLAVAGALWMAKMSREENGAYP